MARRELSAEEIEQMWSLLETCISALVLAMAHDKMVQGNEGTARERTLARNLWVALAGKACDQAEALGMCSHDGGSGPSTYGFREN